MMEWEEAAGLGTTIGRSSVRPVEGLAVMEHDGARWSWMGESRRRWGICTVLYLAEKWIMDLLGTHGTCNAAGGKRMDADLGHDVSVIT